MERNESVICVRYRRRLEYIVDEPSESAHITRGFDEFIVHFSK